MSKVINLPFDEDAIDDELDDDKPFDNSFMNDWSEDSFREYCGTILELIAKAIDAMNEEMSDFRHRMDYIHPDMEDLTERLETVEGRNRRLSMDVAQLQRRLIPAAIGSAALLGASIITGAVLRKRR